MKDKIIIDLGQMMDEIFQATENFQKVFKEGFRSRGEGHPFFKWDENVDYYPAYSYPPANVYMTEEKSLIFEFALAGFNEKDITLEFRGDYMVLNAKTVEEKKNTEKIKYFKHRLRYKDIVDQRYFAPGDKFDREQVVATYKSGILTVSIPAKADAVSKEGIKINIVSEEE